MKRMLEVIFLFIALFTTFNSAMAEQGIQTIRPNWVIDSPSDSQQYFLDSNGSLLLSRGYPSDSQNWFALSRIENGNIVGLSNFAYQKSAPITSIGYIVESLNPGIFWVSETSECVLRQGEGCPPTSVPNIRNKIVKSDGSVINQNFDLSQFSKAMLTASMNDKILMSRGTSTASPQNPKERIESSELALFDISTLNAAKLIYRTEIFNQIKVDYTEFGSTGSQIFTDGSALVQLQGIRGDSKNCRNYLKLTPDGKSDDVWINKIEKTVSNKSGKTGFSLAWVWADGLKAPNNTIVFYGKTEKNDNSCRGHAVGDEFKIYMSPSGEIKDIELIKYFGFDYANKVLDCFENTGCIIVNSKSEITWANAKLDIDDKSTKFLLLPPDNFNTSFIIKNAKTRQQSLIQSSVARWSGNELVGMYGHNAYFKIWATYKDENTKSTAMKEFIAEYKIPQSLYSEIHNLALNDKAKNSKDKKSIVCKKGSSKLKVSGINPKCPRGFK